MNFRSLSVAFLGATVLSGAVAAFAAAIPASVEISSITPIQTYNPGETANDQAYVVVTGVAAGKPIAAARFPQTGAWTAAPKQPPIDSKKPVELWNGSLDDGQFALVTVTLFQGKGDDAKIKEFEGKLEAANKGIAELGKPTLGSADDLKKLATEKVKADRAVISKIKDTFSREKKTDHYGAQFSVILWNNKGKIAKRLDPVGLTFGEHNGLDVKVYTKLKNSRNNVIAKNEKGQWEMQQFEPTNDDSTEIRVKGLETEMIPQAGGNPLRHTTDYLIGVTAKAGGKALTWTVEDQQNNEDAIHVYWNYAD